MFFGALLTGTANLILAPLMGIFMLIYAYGLWSGRAFALPMGIAYAAFATLNVILFPFVHGLGTVGVLPYLGFAVVGIGVPWAAVWLLAQHLRAPA